MGFFNRDKTDYQKFSERIGKLALDISEVQQQIKSLKEDIDKLEIKALESRKIYKKKLNALVGDEDKENNSNNPLIFGR